jgi:hypothetical protein
MELLSAMFSLLLTLLELSAGGRSPQPVAQAKTIKQDISPMSNFFIAILLQIYVF